MELKLGSINDALGAIGSELKSPTFGAVQNFQNSVTGLKTKHLIDPYAMGIAHPEAANDIATFLDDVEEKTTILENCGNLAMDTLSAATTDYIKNTGIQQAGRDLNEKLNGITEGLDCLVGFSALLKSKDMFDDSVGIADLPQMKTRLTSIIADATNPNKLSNLLMNMDAVTGIMGNIQGVCDAMNAGFKKLVEADLAVLAGTLNKLAQWAAFAKIAKSDPCALVTNNKMFSHITSPVVDDIIALYDKATSGIPALASIVDVNIKDFTNPLANLNPNFNMDPLGGLVSFDNYSDNLGAGLLGGVVGNALGGGAGAALGAAAGLGGMFNESSSLFSNNKDTVEFAPLLKGGLGNIAAIGIGSCAGGDTFASMPKPECLANGGNWTTDVLSGGDFDLAASASSFFGGFGDFISGIELPDFSASGLGLGAPSKPSGKDSASAPGPAQAHDRATAYVAGWADRMAPMAAEFRSSATPIAASFAASAPAIGAVLQDIPTNLFQVPDLGAKLQGATNFGRGGFDNIKSVIKEAQASGNYSEFTAYKCVGGKVYDTDESSCRASGGSWLSQSGTKFNTSKLKNVVSSGMNTSSVNKELQTILPTSKAFDVTLIG